MSILDAESYGFSPNAADYATYGRTYSMSAVTIGTGGLYNDPICSFGGGAGGPAGYTRRQVGGGSNATLIFQTRLLVPAGASYTVYFFDLVNNAAQVSFTFNGSNGTITVMRGSTVLLVTNANVFPVNARFYMGVQATIAAGTGGSCAAWIGATQVINLTNVNTQNTSRAFCDTTATSAYGCNEQHSLWLSTAGSYNNAYIGDKRVYGNFPNAAGDSTQFTPFGNASNYLNAATSPPVDGTDYNQSGTVGNIDLYKGAAGSGFTGVAGAQISLIGRQDAAGSRAWATQFKSGGVVASGTSTAMASSSTTLSSISETDPSTGVPILPSAIAALQWGAKVTA